MRSDAVEMLRLELHGKRVGYLAGYRSGRSIMVFDEAWRLDDSRPTLSLTLQPDCPHAAELMQSPWIRQQRLHPWFSNLLQEGALEGLPAINLPDEQLAYAIRRYDREGERRIHAEDMAQVLFRYSHEKYDGPSYERLGRLLREYTGDGLANVQAFVRRLLVDILLANRDAHLKNWSLIYPDQRTPRLAPAYDIVTTLAYLEHDHQLALNLNGKKAWYRLGEEDFRRWSERVGVAWPAIRTVLDDTLKRARAQWPDQLNEMPMAEVHKAILRQHWRNLAPEWRIDASR